MIVKYIYVVYETGPNLRHPVIRGLYSTEELRDNAIDWLRQYNPESLFYYDRFALDNPHPFKR